ncbi:MAG TPA: TonB family protein [Terriglobales bacterium]|nr:TonB family protein [Terriglobales bacterium]
MASILTPPDRSTSLPHSDDDQLALWSEQDSAGPEITPHLLLQLEDELERSRTREAFWISVVVHLMVVIFLFMSPKIFPGTKGVVLISPADLMRNQQMTYLDLPPDMQKAPKVAPKTDVLSDKNRIAESRHPMLDKKTLEELKRAGPPKPPAAPAQQAKISPPAMPAQPPQSQAPNQAQNQQSGQLQNALPQDNPRLPAQQQSTPKFPTSMAGIMSPGSSIEQAERAVAARRGGGTFGGGGDYGVGPGGSARVQGNLEVLTDTEGVDFGPYLSRVLQAVRMNWYNLIPEEARPPLLKKGKVSIEFVILKDGKVGGMKIVGPSGDVSLDRAAWGGITASLPFAPLPTEFHGPYLGLRFHFYYNPGKGDIE